MSEYDEKKHICIEGALPDNYPWSDHFPEHHLHKHPSFFHYLLHGLSLQYPTSGAAVSGMIRGIREFKHAIVGMFSVPVVFSVDVKDGDLVRPISYQEAEDREILEMMVDLKNIPEAIWVPVFKYPEDEVSPPKSVADFTYTDYNPFYYGIAYTKLHRVMVGPLVFHPKFKFGTGDKIYALDDGSLTTEANKHFVGTCLAPYFIFLSQDAAMIQAAMKDFGAILKSETIKETLKLIQSGEVDLTDATVSVPGRSHDRTLGEHFSDEVNVKDFGAKGDGVTNDDAAFNRAIQYCLSLGDDACLFLPVGTYLLTREPGVPCYGPGKVKIPNTLYKAFELLFTIHGGIKRDSNGRFYIDLQDMLGGGAGSEGDKIFQNLINTIAEALLPDPRNGGLELDKDKKLIIDLRNLTNAQRIAFVKEIILTGGGLGYDSVGRLKVNFAEWNSGDLRKFLEQIIKEGGGLVIEEGNKLVVKYDFDPAQIGDGLTFTKGTGGKLGVLSLASHAHATNKYGQGTSSTFGHVKLTDSLSNSGASSGIGISSKGVKDAIEDFKDSIESRIKQIENNVGNVSQIISNYVVVLWNNDGGPQRVPSGGTWRFVTIHAHNSYAFDPYGGTVSGGSLVPEMDNTGRPRIAVAVRVS